MTISWFGISSFKIVGKDITIITDPFGSNTGLSPVRGAADAVIVSNPKSPLSGNYSSISGEPFMVAGSGEYEIKGAGILGTPAESDPGGGIIYSIELEDIRIAFLGLIKQSTLTDTQKEVLEGADVVLIGVGNGSVLNFEQAAKIATQLEPFYVIPHTYAISGLKGNFDRVDRFIKEMGEPIKDDKLTIKKKDLAGDITKLVVLDPQR
ncbi:MAG: hypothetical protein A3E98_01665 [Candidatus Doudnabacteria bacterium RIFCSPHIGHO2_12_FULL_48_11]|uniref:Lactamase n=1 Tax=Candidatus Doudnabacteria bacterium RIFCSPHIGHO2_01_FULL_46_24 TaxID=1817825 RepID=A0A1F5NTH2_9BACT|nr:MAG: hypothetical protein A2720_04715 [Candidatus Doudnabacteria bacterium RIFCSPHIGHO2_01_FULL_46_24]OGE95853.1 MAG: hypothetical protein A3E98_01665 [Candidatus Doudnabacteria bacterium RIFCSPHIGHO2_12_FULL_48_11]